MRIPYRTDHCAIRLAAFMTQVPIVALRAQDAVAPAATNVASVCTANGVLDLPHARELRDLIRYSDVSADRLVELRKNLDVSILHCEPGLNTAAAAFLDAMRS